MAYEWDSAKARKDYLIKVAAACALAICFAGLPVWWLVTEAHF